ncbi:MAG: hypothetical protein AVDCRST_MAG68-790 [uncultured Gemmatimonadetes bacterium]|uniref:IPT/TIG domain-containing protein n=1 Tax=uncultured Gemmatimonadota bacterium TaxID=203437 RepID=A0A6J4KHU3_9BACT|nr:MAG: hypothetical protein AVDCRST_MAG68-790 [uncultured Gemmatimonadota bacterium]
MRSRTIPTLVLLALATSASAAAQVRPMPRPVPRPVPPTVARPIPAAVAAVKHERLTPVQRLTRGFESGSKSGAYFGVLMHSVDRVLSGSGNGSEMDVAVQRALERNPASREVLGRMVADYRAIPVDVRARRMPRELAVLDRGTGLSHSAARRFVSAPAGASGIIVQGGLQGPGRRIGTVRPAPDAGPAAPRIDAVAATLQTGGARVVLDGSFHGTSPIAPVYLRPAGGQSLESSGFQTVDGEQVVVALGRVDGARSRVEVTLPAGMQPGPYDVAVRVPRGAAGEPKSNWRRLELAPFAYTVRLLSIRCLDESDPETVLAGPEVHDEIVVSWAAFADQGPAMIGWTQEYEGFDDNEEQTIRMHPTDDGALFLALSGGTPVPGVVANRLFVVAQLAESDESSDFRIGGSPVGAFFADIGRASLDELDVQLFQEKLSQALHWATRWASTYDEVGEVRLSFSAAELQQMTNNSAGRHRDRMLFRNSDDRGSYAVEYEIRRHGN